MDSYGSNFRKTSNEGSCFVKNNWKIIKINIEHLLKYINVDSNQLEKINNEKEKLFPSEDSEEYLSFYNKISFSELNNLKYFLNSLEKYFPSNSLKFKTIFKSINSQISQIEEHFRRSIFLQINNKEQNDNSNEISNEAIKDIFIENMREGITSDQKENYEVRKKLRALKEKSDLLNFVTQKNIDHVSKSLMYYQEYKLEIENPQDSLKIEKKMFKSSLDLIFVTNSIVSSESNS